MALSVTCVGFLSEWQRPRWPTGLRSGMTRGRTMATVRRSWPHLPGREVFKGATKPTLAPHSRLCLLSHSLHARAEKLSRHCRRPLRRARERSPPHHHQPNCVPRSALSLATSSSSLRLKPSRGKAAILMQSPREARRSSAVLELVVVDPAGASISLFLVA
jgi:hypothetical protein